jgi:hypothetical protein
MKIDWNELFKPKNILQFNSHEEFDIFFEEYYKEFDISYDVKNRLPYTTSFCFDVKRNMFMLVSTAVNNDYKILNFKDCVLKEEIEIKEEKEIKLNWTIINKLCPMIYCKNKKEKELLVKLLNKENYNNDNEIEQTFINHPDTCCVNIFKNWACTKQFAFIRSYEILNFKDCIMTNEEEIQNEIKETEQKLLKLRNKLENEKIPTMDEVYEKNYTNCKCYYTDSNCDIVSVNHYCDSTDYNLHKTEEEAEATLLYIQWKNVANFVDCGLELQPKNWEVGCVANTYKIKYYEEKGIIFPNSIYFNSLETSKKAVAIMIKEYGKNVFKKMMN